MKTTTAQPIADASDDTQLSTPHDFNMEAVIGNNFGQGDDHRPADPMTGSPFAAQLRSAARSEQQGML